MNAEIQCKKRHFDPARSKAGLKWDIWIHQRGDDLGKPGHSDS